MKWTGKIRRYLYEELYKSCGSYGSPTFTNKAKVEFCKRMKEELPKKFKSFEVKTYKAIQNQIDWGVQRKQGTINSRGFVYNYILNRAAALECGVLKSKDLPEMLLASDPE